jgi:hypothetical protein
MPDSGAARIFVQIASYRDRECQWTVKDLFDKAHDPDRVFVGICWQTIAGKDQDCFEVEARPEQVRTVHFAASDTNGVCWARQQASDLWRGEEYLLQIDSHMRFVEGWDDKMLGMLEACDSPEPVLTVYPPPYEPPHELSPRDHTVVQAIKAMSPVGFISYTTRPVPPDRPVDRPFPTASLAAGFLFGPSRIITDVPQDPLIFFNGEEPNLAIRLWTHGCDLFSPNEDVIFHYYIRKDGSRPWNDFDHFGRMQRISAHRMRQLCEPGNVPPGEEIDLGDYGIGTARSLAAFEEFAGVNFAGRTIASYARRFPYVLTDEVDARLARGDEIEIAPESQLFIIDEHGFLYTKQKGNLIHLNPAAAYVWCALEDGIGLDAINGQLVANGVGDEGQVRRQLMILIAHLQGEGALMNVGAPAVDAEAESPKRSRPTVDPEILQRGAAADGHYGLLDERLRIDFEDAALKAAVDPFLEDLIADPSGAPTHTLSLCRGAADEFLLIEESELANEAFRPAHSAFFIRALLRDRAMGAPDMLFHIRGAMVARDDRGTVILEVGEYAKDPLVAALLARDYALFSCAAVPVLHDTLRARPVPMALSLREVDTLSLDPDSVKRSVSYERSGGEAMQLVFPPSRSHAAADRQVDIKTVVFVHRDEGGDTAVEPMGRAEGLLRLLGGFMIPSEPFSLAEVTRVIDVVEDVAFYTLAIGKLGEAADAFERLARDERRSI